MHYIFHRFSPGETVDAIMRLKGRHDFSREEILVLREKFNELNGSVVPRSGQIFKIPLQMFVTDDFGNLLDIDAIAAIVPVSFDPTIAYPKHPENCSPIADDDKNRQELTSQEKEIKERTLNEVVEQPVEVIHPVLSVSGTRRVSRL